MIGVEVETAQGREIINLRSGGSVLLAAGVMSTPRVLFNSGIGPSKQINIVKSGTTKVKLPDERDWISLPVGLDIKDHSRYMLNFNATDGLATKSKQQLLNPSESDKDLYRAGSRRANSVLPTPRYFQAYQNVWRPQHHVSDALQRPSE